jgi:hypothetical protein
MSSAGRMLESPLHRSGAYGESESTPWSIDLPENFKKLRRAVPYRFPSAAPENGIPAKDLVSWFVVTKVAVEPTAHRSADSHPFKC